MAKQKKTIEERVQADYPEFHSTVATLSVTELEKRLSEYAKHRNQVEESQEADEDLEMAKAQVSELGAPYRDAKKEINMKSKYIINMIKEKGGKA